MAKKIQFPQEYRGARLGKGWYEDSRSHAQEAQDVKNEEINGLFSNMLKGKIEEAFAKAREAKEKRNAAKEGIVT